ncbi:uncharacterized protein N7515_008860 [Penicillium bovifimosum]|uniref:Uncharacterized protein n=1 Tax=Penicillium bovifimosum TaxID=126998 RepID=A0A9W9KXS8_9EURO|nr:uncharacterized protein N7515_008860 [Penicillium bovifimosum]KAJ5125035.1 hypothetical protein N7515_008860 [Penicillium bovifimosum]
MLTLGFPGLYEGTVVDFTTPSSQKWVLEKKLTEDAQQMSKWELDGGGGPPFTVFTYRCRSATDSEKKAFMRIYFQIPIAGNGYRLEDRQQQAAPPRKHPELDVAKDLRLRECPVVPTFLAYKEGKQDNDARVPGGYITHVVWEKVPGESLNQDKFWDPQSGLLREAIRAKFRDVWEELKHYGWQPAVHGLRNIIYDEVTGTMHIAGFRVPARLDPEEEFTDLTFVRWCLAIPPKNADWKRDSTKWAW